MKTPILLLSACLLAVAPTWAQLLPGLPRLPTLPPLSESRLPAPLAQRLPVLRELGEQRLLPRTELLQELLRRPGTPWMADPRGFAVLRDELIWLSPSEVARARAEKAGWQLLEALPLRGLGLSAWRVAPPAGRDAVAAQAELQALDAEGGGEAELQHLYLPAGDLQGAGGKAGAETGRRSGGDPAAGLGLIDGGLDLGHPALNPKRLRLWGCAPAAKPPASAHGTAVASLLVGEAEGLRSAWPGAALAAADIYCGEPRGGSVARLVAALDWLASAGVAVVNISLVGPPNRLLEQAVNAARAQGLVLVAAVGNDGPAAPPLYPAAYPGVVAVAGLDARRRPLPESGRGAHLVAVAQGSELAVAQLGGGLAQARGSSFAAPWLAGRLARAWNRSWEGLPRTPARAEALLAALRAQLDDLGEPGRDPIYGYGYAGPTWQPRPAPSH